MRKALTALVLIFGALGAASPALAEARALVVGIDAYDHERRLFGAVADSNDVSQSLRRFGLQDVTLLQDRAANKAAIEGAWRAMVARAAPGDTVIFAYAGHGSHEPDLNGDESLVVAGDDRDENFILSGFSEADPGERIVDDELDQWFKAALDKGLKVLFVADSCHAGTVNRSGGAVAGRLASGAASVLDGLNERTPNLQSQAPDAARAPADPKNLYQVRPNMFFVSAVEQARPVKEVRIDGVVRGALSYAFSRALDGAADYNKDGTLDHLELGHYLEQVSSAYDDEARREFWPRGGAPQAVLTRSAGASSAAPLPPARASETEVRLALRGGGTLSLPGLQIVTEAPDLVYDQTTEKILDPEGVTVAENVKASPQAILPILEKYKILKLVQKMTAISPLSASLSPPGPSGFHEIGSAARIDVPQGGRPWLTVFNLANKGEVQSLFPGDPSEEAHRLTQSPYGFPTRVSEPPGADHLIFIATDREPAALRAALKSGADARGLLDLLQDLSAAGGVSANVVPFYSKRSGG